MTGRALDTARARLDAQEEERAALRRALGRSLDLESLWPGIWATGPGKARSRWRRSGHALCLEVTAPGGEVRVFARPQVPEALRNPEAEAEARAWLARYAPRRLAAFNAGRI